ncbi:MAG: NTP transferase domain-containing protein [Planctomycetota bacterium]|nr:NTP transferase domain-containing protein [Planctomycetota bacterium]
MNTDNPQTDKPLAAIILAAGQGTRMQSDLPKVVHAVAGRSMVSWVVDAVRQAGASRIILIVGHGADLVRAIFEGQDDIVFATQHEQLGTGHATACAEPELRDFEGDVVVLAGDGPLIRAKTIQTMRRVHSETGAAATLATSVIEDPTGYGRIIRGTDGRFEAIVEHKNASDEQKAIREIYPSYACFDTKLLFEMLSTLKPDKVTNEYYVTDIPSMLTSNGHRVELVEAVPPEDVLSINTLQQLADVDAILTQRLESAGVEAGS